MRWVTIPRAQVGPDPRTPLHVELDSHPAFVTVVVTPSLHSLVRQERTSAHSLTREDHVLSPAVGNDASRVVQRLPGVAATDNSAAFHSRGSLVEDVSWVLDGLELYDPFHLTNFQSPFSLLDTNVVDRIDFSGGGFTADLGDRHGGFVEIDTLVPGKTATGAVELGTVNSRIAYSTPFPDSHGSWLFSARGWYPNQFNDSIQIAAGENIAPYFGDSCSKATFLLSPKASLSAHALYVYDRLTFTETAEEDVNEVVDVLTKNSDAWLRLLTMPSSH